MKTTNLLLTSALVLSAVAAHAAVEIGDVIGISEADIRTNLENQGYDVQSIMVDGDEIEIDALFGGEEIEIELSSSTGAVTEVESEEVDDDENEEGEDND